jgi:hypothetical protein
MVPPLREVRMEKQRIKQNLIFELCGKGAAIQKSGYKGESKGR